MKFEDVIAHITKAAMFLAGAPLVAVAGGLVGAWVAVLGLVDVVWPGPAKGPRG